MPRQLQAGVMVRLPRGFHPYALKAGPCTDCEVSYPPYVMQFDHRDPETKLFKLDFGQMTRAWDRILAEVAKCDLVCANCHAERTHQQHLINPSGHRKRQVS